MEEKLFETLLRDKFAEYERFTKENITNILIFSDLCYLFVKLDSVFRLEYNKSIFFDNPTVDTTYQDIVDHLNLVIDFLTDEYGRINVDKVLESRKILLYNKKLERCYNNCYRINNILTNMLVGRYVGIGPGELFVSFFISQACVHGSSITDESECFTLESMSYDIDTKHYGKFEIKMLDDGNEIRLGGVGTPSNFRINEQIVDFLKNMDLFLKDYDLLDKLYDIEMFYMDKDCYLSILQMLINEFNNVSKKGNKHLKNTTLYDKYIHGEFSQSDFNKLDKTISLFKSLLTRTHNVAYEKRKSILENLFIDYTYRIDIPVKRNKKTGRITRFNKIIVNADTFKIVEIIDILRELCYRLNSLADIKNSIEWQLSEHLEQIPILAIKNIPIGSDIIPENCFVGIFTELPFKRMTANKFKFYVKAGAKNND